MSRTKVTSGSASHCFSSWVKQPSSRQQKQRAVAISSTDGCVCVCLSMHFVTAVTRTWLEPEKNTCTWLWTEHTQRKLYHEWWAASLQHHSTTQNMFFNTIVLKTELPPTHRELRPHLFSTREEKGSGTCFSEPDLHKQVQIVGQDACAWKDTG